MNYVVDPVRFKIAARILPDQHMKPDGYKKGIGDGYLLLDSGITASTSK